MHCPKSMQNIYHANTQYLVKNHPLCKRDYSEKTRLELDIERWTSIINSCVPKTLKSNLLNPSELILRIYV